MSLLIILSFLLGVSAISTGFALIAIPYGLIAAGAGLVLLSVILAKGQDSGGDDRRKR